MSVGIRKTGHAGELNRKNEISVLAIRERIAGVKREIPRLALAFQYLASTRACETVGRARGQEANWGVYAEDLARSEYDGHAVAVFKLSTAKRGGVSRNIALPLEPVYENWTAPIAQYFDEIGEGPVFRIDRQTLHAEASKAFAGLYYPIEPYTGAKARHYRSAATHALRHLRTTELAEIYGFDAEERAQYCGWTAAGARIPAMIARYDMVNWRRYFPKLLTPSPYGIELRRGRL